MEKQYNVNCGKQYLKIPVTISKPRTTALGKKKAMLCFLLLSRGFWWGSLTSATFFIHWQQRLFKVSCPQQSTMKSLHTNTDNMFLRAREEHLYFHRCTILQRSSLFWRLFLPHMGNLNSEMSKELSQGHITNKWLSWDLNPCISVPEI